MSIGLVPRKAPRAQIAHVCQVISPEEMPNGGAAKEHVGQFPQKRTRVASFPETILKITNMVA